MNKKYFFNTRKIMTLLADSYNFVLFSFICLVRNQSKAVRKF